VYVGSSQDSRKRIYVHRWKLERGDHDNIALQRAWDRYGADGFSFDILEVVENVDLLIEREQYWIDQLKSASTESGYNFCPVAGTRRGSKQPPHVAEVLRLAHKGKPKSAEHRAKIGAGNAGKRRSKKTRALLSEIATKQFADPAAREAAAERTRKQFEDDPQQRAMARKRLARMRRDPIFKRRQRLAVIRANRARART
jgi:group I intron endonuclease